MTIQEKVEQITEQFNKRYQTDIHHFKVKKNWFSRHCGMKTLKLIPYVNEDVNNECSIHKAKNAKRLSKYTCDFVEICQCEECSYSTYSVRMYDYQ